MAIKTDQTLDARGLACPMPIVKTKKAMGDLEAGQVMEVQATDKGSTADIKAWAGSTGHQYLGTVENDDVLHHYLRKATDDEEKPDIAYSKTAAPGELAAKIENGDSVTVLDVRQPAEYAFGHIPGAVHIPLGELDERTDELKRDDDIYVICRSGSRSDLASRKLDELGFEKVTNVVPGMMNWEGPEEK